MKLHVEMWTINYECNNNQNNVFTLMLLGSEIIKQTVTILKLLNVILSLYYVPAGCSHSGLSLGGTLGSAVRIRYR